MINLNDMPEEFYDIIFGDVTVEEFLPNIIIECRYREEEVSIYGRIIISKESNTVTLLNIECSLYDKCDQEYPLETTYRLARKDKWRISELLAVFKESNSQFGYNKDIKTISL